jgi:putative oxidoreductase
VTAKILPATVTRCYKSSGKIAFYAQSVFLLLIRLYWGWQFAQTGWGKLHNLPQITTFFASLNLPFPALTAHFVADVEFVGGLLLIFGLLSRFTGLVLGINMMVAYWTADRVALQSIFSDPGKFYGADPYTFLFASLMILTVGAGLFSLDRLFAKWIADKMPRQ